jgi:hypothetical protein
MTDVKANLPIDSFVSDIAEITENIHRSVNPNLPTIPIPDPIPDSIPDSLPNVNNNNNPVTTPSTSTTNISIQIVHNAHPPITSPTCLRDVVIDENCDLDCAIDLIMKLQKHFGFIHQTFETAEDYNENPEWFKTNIGKISRSLNHKLECQCGENIDLHDQVEFLIKSMKHNENPSKKNCSIQ